MALQTQTASAESRTSGALDEGGRPIDLSGQGRGPCSVQCTSVAPV